MDEDDVWDIAQRCEGYSGSDVATLANEALLLPIKEMQVRILSWLADVLTQTKAARFFKRDEAGKWVASLADPPCPHCPMLLSGESPSEKPCARCGYTRLDIFSPDVKKNELADPPVTRDHFLRAAETIRPTVLDTRRFERWTKEMGEMG